MSWSDLTGSADPVFLETFGEEVEFQSGKSDSTPITGIWSDNEAQLPKGISATMWALESAFNPLPQKNDIVRRGEYEYRVVDPDNLSSGYKRTGDGGILIFLKAVRRNANA